MKKLPTRNDLAYALELLSDQPRRPGEFTLSEAHAQHVADGGTLTRRQLEGRLTDLLTSGRLTKRYSTINGMRTNLFRRQDAS